MIIAALPTAGAHAGWWLLAGIAIAACVAPLGRRSTVDTGRAAKPLAYLEILGLAAAGGAVAGTVGLYLVIPWWALASAAVIVVGLFAALASPDRLTVPLAAAVLIGLTVFVLTCVTITPEQPVVVSGGGSAAGALVAALACYPAFAVGRVLAAVVVGVTGAAVAAAALHQMGAARFGLSRAPLRDAVVAADAGALHGFLAVVVVLAAALTVTVLLKAVRATSAVVAPGDTPTMFAAVAMLMVCLAVPARTSVLVAGGLLVVHHLGVIAVRPR
ncbi:APA family basic amino acid/polyamine antiporter [Herbihabitans rhizosphaerae]|uniref:APA family basic amino acid/polyamine antiporter n=1 Tax=Herbihabitans rhizosphaerae TaxID=1872711 RepID=A0A4Q7KRZ6_9PSEU|nr:APA family basic amino acid/polyamine antiporter [Herbihabitans rhizosphaerae]